jgi:hypothetical protein
VQRAGAVSRFACTTALAVASLPGCMTLPLEPRVVLDESTGASVTVADQPLVMARERRDVAVRARDYLTLVAAEINISGRRQLVWIVHQWSTIDARAADLPPMRDAPLLLVADGRDLRLIPVNDATARSYARSPALGPPEDSGAVTTVYAVDDATLEFVAGGKRLSATLPDSRLALPFTLWRDGRPALQRFLLRTRQ